MDAVAGELLLPDPFVNTIISGGSGTNCRTRIDAGPMPDLWEYRATWLNIVDGDTIDVRTDLGFDMTGLKMRLRLLGIDTPEVTGETKEAGLIAKTFAHEWLSAHCDDLGRVFIRSQRSTKDVDKKDSFGRYLATVYNLIDGDTCGDHCLNAALLDSGNAIPYTS